MKDLDKTTLCADKAFFLVKIYTINKIVHRNLLGNENIDTDLAAANPYLCKCDRPEYC